MRREAARPAQLTWPQGEATADVGDAVLMDRLARGDPDALAALYDRHGGVCYTRARQVTGSATLAQDAVQETFVGLWRAPGGYSSQRASVRTWLLAVTHHKAVDLVRKEMAERRRFDAQAAAMAVEPIMSPDPASIVSGYALAVEVRSALGELPEEQREALALAYYGGHTQRQIAELTGVPLGTVKTRMYLAMRKLRLRFASSEDSGNRAAL